MTVDVVAAGSAEVTTPAAPAPDPGVPAEGAFSPLDFMRGKRAEINSKLFLDLPVPRWDDVLGWRLWVRYRPATPTTLGLALEARQKTAETDPEWSTKAYADMLVGSCIVIYGLALGSEPNADLTPPDALTFGSPELAEVLGVTVRDASEVCRATYATDGDLVVAANQLIEWSAVATPRADADFLAH